MDPSRETYLVMIQETDPTLSFGESIRASFFTASNFKKAYNMAIDRSKIGDPRPGYRAALSHVRSSLAVTIKDRDGSKETIISVIFKY
jgi:hypothetical protein